MAGYKAGMIMTLGREGTLWSPSLHNEPKGMVPLV